MITSEQISTVAQVGDRWMLSRLCPDKAVTQIPLGLSWSLLLSEEEEIHLQDHVGMVHSTRFCAIRGVLKLQRSATWTPPTGHHRIFLELLSLAPKSFRLVVEPFTAQTLAQEFTTEKGVRISFHDDFKTLICPPGSWARFQLSRRASYLASAPDFENLISLPMLRDVELYEHQIKTAKVVLRRFRGRALLCDEVGLGKTVEAGLILLELFARKLARKVLILTPPSLIAQWQAEMQRKFGLQFVSHDDPAFRELKEKAWQSHDLILASYHTAKLEPYRSWISKEQWDMVIVDEAHHLRNSKTVLWKFASALQKKYILLLTATPMQNSLDDLYNLVTLLKPGLLSTAKQFKKQFASKEDNFSVRNVDELHSLIAECMVRNRRSCLAMNFTKRFAKTLRITPSSEEMTLYTEITDFVKAHLKEEKPTISRMSLISIQKFMGSSLHAVVPLLKQIIESEKITSTNDRTRLFEMLQKAQNLRNSAKTQNLLSLLKEFPEKMVIFTQFRATQVQLYDVLKASGENVTVFHGSLTRLQKEEAVRSFREESRILISTDSGSEGRNLQFCNAICNFDLPWNPMRLEQRIGRISRIGQTRDVHVFNLVNAETIEDHVLRVLEAKVNLFELVIGEMDMIFGNLEEEREFEEVILDMWLEAEDQQKFAQEMEKFGDRLVTAKEEYLRQQACENKLFGDKFTAKE